MPSRQRLRWIPMLIQAYRQARERTEIHHELTTVSSQSELPISRATSRKPARNSVRTAQSSRKTAKPQPRVRNTISPHGSQRLIRELRTGNRKSWERLESIEQKIQHVESKIESLKEDLEQSQIRQETTRRQPSQMYGQPTMPPDLPPWI
ncbi:hypothetical protein [Alicyclobacillus ferrooxydans]|nr:hypothetical protein [Alicyclobacillus ferrooxydans]